MLTLGCWHLSACFGTLTGVSESERLNGIGDILKNLNIITSVSEKNQAFRFHTSVVTWRQVPSLKCWSTPALLLTAISLIAVPPDSTLPTLPSLSCHGTYRSH